MPLHVMRFTLTKVANSAAIAMLFIAVASDAAIPRAQAHGAVAQFTREAGPFVVTVFTTPSPLQAGPVDISLLIQSRENQQPVLDCVALIQLRKDDATTVHSEATHEAAENKLLYQAQVKVPESGVWQLEVAITHESDSVEVGGAITVASSSPVVLAYWRSLALPPLLISLFALNQLLKRRSLNFPLADPVGAALRGRPSVRRSRASIRVNVKGVTP
jgi:hypothetical protein